MSEKLPKVFANEIDHDITNNKNFFKSSDNQGESTSNERNTSDNKVDYNTTLNINNKIKKLFASSIHKYTIDAKITTNEGTFVKRVVGTNNTNLITLDNELIPISSIIDIEEN